MERTRLGLPLLFLTATLAAGSSGCIVPQPRGGGTQTHEVEPRVGRGYFRYLPKPYVEADAAGRKARRWPVVVSFHGMKPFDNAGAQSHEWEQEADRYGFVVIAPELLAPDVLREFPVRHVTDAFKQDEEATLACLDHLFANVEADPGNVLATSWSSGGYMAHYMANRHPDRFTCVGVRQSNFSSAILDEANATRERYHPILIINTENDFKICVDESAEAVQWYTARGYQNVWWVRIKGLGHERTPDLAAAFFGRVANVRPLTAPTVLAHRQAIDGNPAGLAFLSGLAAEIHAPPAGKFETKPVGTPPVLAASLPPTPARKSDWLSADNSPSPVKPEQRPVTVRSVPKSAPPSMSATPDRAKEDANLNVATAAGNAQNAKRDPNVKIRLSSAIGIEPLLLGFSVDCPSDWLRSADFLWTLDGEPICNDINGQKALTKSGVYELGVLVVTSDGVEHRAAHNVRVLPRLAKNGEATASRQ